MAKSKKSNLPKLEKSDLAKVKKFAKINSSGIDFLTLEIKKAFIYLHKAFIEALILRHFNLEYYIWTETNASGYAISRVLSQITLDQPSSNHMTHKNLDSISLKSDTGQ